MSRDPPPQLVRPLPECSTCGHYTCLHMRGYVAPRMCCMEGCECEDLTEEEPDININQETL
jgi:hypothetical protein